MLKFIEINLLFSLHKYNDLMKKKRIVENDKKKIIATIEELDQKKNEALHIAWQKVCDLKSSFHILARIFSSESDSS